MTTTVLVVDDEPEARESIGRLLQDEQYAVRSAESVAQAAQILESEREDIDVVVVDMLMNENPKAGLDVIRFISQKA